MFIINMDIYIYVPGLAHRVRHWDESCLEVTIGSFVQEGTKVSDYSLRLSAYGSGFGLS